MQETRRRRVVVETKDLTPPMNPIMVALRDAYPDASRKDLRKLMKKFKKSKYYKRSMDNVK